MTDEQSTENLSSVWQCMPCFSCGQLVWSVRYGGGEWWPATEHICPANDRLAARVRELEAACQYALERAEMFGDPELAREVEAALGGPAEQEER